MKRVIILGSTGSIGTQALEIIRRNPDQFKVVGLSAGGNLKLLNNQIDEFKPLYAVADKARLIRDDVIIPENSTALVRETEADIILLAMVGISGLAPAYEAVGKGVRIALANKETLVAAGEIIMKRARDCNSEIIPVDSEHSAIWQCLHAGKSNLKRIILTASGGAFRDYTIERLKEAKATDALKHPVWSMGAKVTIDSATLMNKGLEIIEAMRLFNAEQSQIVPVIHPESVIHSMVEFCDNSIIAEMSRPDMSLPIQLAFTYPERITSTVESVDFIKLGALTFKEPDRKRFPCLQIAEECARQRGASTAVMNAANEVAVEMYLKGAISFYDMPALINSALDKKAGVILNSIEDIIGIDREVKEYILSSSL
jgi:1-deoxy-D-xylulose-5-phosphate reductoisomerase